MVTCTCYYLNDQASFYTRFSVCSAFSFMPVNEQKTGQVRLRIKLIISRIPANSYKIL